MKRSEILTRINSHEALLIQRIKEHDKERKKALKMKDENAASYHWGRIIGMSDGITSLQVISEYLEHGKLS